MDADDLRVFEAVARLGSMNRAATELNTVQSNVTGRIRALEAELGVSLFHRHARGVSPTEAAQRLLPYAGRVRRLLADARRAARDDGTPAGPLVIGSLETTAAMRLAPLLAGYAGAYPDVDLSLRTGTTCEMIDDVLAHRVEGAFVCGPVDHPELVAETVFHEELVALTAPGVRHLDALVAAGDFRIVVLRAGCSYRLRLEAWLSKRGIVGVRVLEFGTLEAILACVGAGLGMTLLPRGLVETARRAGQVGVHVLPPEDAMVETVFLRRRDGYVSSALEAFLGLLRPAWAQAAE
ncbi:LysR family transcriptional regulator [Rhodopila globiformis]|uniref:LysR family transcriptional regulator n=1 Tax=Rhodopila globiformis TaxID=1071 RepID=A0A2S6NMN8_RHOGL|nr:LysR family transcriptional regulator [Rhodopila globiformis]PPQ37545.1 LysR family transcriptional regulator [Rhodopila globiformis]